MNTVTGRVVRVISHGSTRWANPMVSVTLDNGETYRVSNDAAVAYGLDNPEYKKTARTYQLTRSGRISGVAADLAGR